ncbi:aromatic amino acid DMT transporter YddG [Chimaeribacter arupi]|uniref:aromatic amino acid DMT transporter YddG n=1 Tax=Chimaeribacter arupi TaxID=2060066 RepID=UPI000C7AF86C|nr:aromatic amino acid DMT transporter YddG [Chimaeribacter arupi]MDV5142054.1 aromatic amino acid DMT transporter YddG [Chimaeribacter arupi]PLR32741.1 EamA family transporter [Chimaeribacter arupi]
MTHKKATLIGLIAIVLWSAIVGLIRSVSEGFGAVGGAAMIYTLSAVLLLFTVGFPRVRAFPRAYLIIGSVLFVCYELCLSLSLGFANTSTQAIEVGMVNYLWPGMTIVLSVLVNRQKTSLVIIPGVILAVAGICRVLGGSEGFSLSQILANLQSNPLSYGLAFTGAMLWAIYCVVTKKIAQGHNGITLFFILTALTLWVKYLFVPHAPFIITPQVIFSLLLAACAMGLGYAAWNVGILHGNVTVLATASYFIPVLSAVLAAFILGSSLTLTFWQGAAMVSLGSLICWWSTRTAETAKITRQA